EVAVSIDGRGAAAKSSEARRDELTHQTAAATSATTTTIATTIARSPRVRRSGRIRTDGVAARSESAPASRP
ncbi:MAG: hypothetical protein Q4F32_02935, partial [Eubacteriales bacterium]|nr:hypothetical protein [Eubacteriales bacterium]